MPTPNDGPLLAPPSPPTLETVLWRSPNSTCPPEDLRVSAWTIAQDFDGRRRQASVVETAPQQQPTPPADAEAVGSPVTGEGQSHDSRRMDCEDELSPVDMLSPTVSTLDMKDNEEPINSRDAPVSHASPVPTMSSPAHPEFSNVRLLPNYTSFLRPGSRFRGTQQSERQVYEVQVELKHVDIDQSFLCGYLRIQGLAEDHPTLTTYFEGEIVGDKYSFHTNHPEWGSNDRVDMHHWARFNAWRPLARPAKKSDFTFKNFAQREHLFMRWKEYFLIPDHKVRTISGASFEGFYYICFNQVLGTVSGIYFHARSEKHQQLELTHVDDRGCFGAMEFR